MSKLFFYIPFSIFFNFVNCENNSTLKLVQVVFRHGSRAPDKHETYPSDPYNDMFENKYGQLTNKGKQESYQLGKILRERYNNFLGEDFYPEMVFTQSTDYDRTKMTALLVLAGLFPPRNGDKWSDELNWLPIPVAYEKTNADYEFVRPIDYCPFYVEELNRILNSEEALDILDKYNSTFEVLTNSASKIYKNLFDVFLFYHLLYSEQYMNLVMPSWIMKEYKAIHYLANMMPHYENYNLVLKKLGGGRMLARIIKNMKEKMEDSIPGRKIMLYSGHDFNVINLLSVLHLYHFNIPTYNAAVLIELHQRNDTKEFFVKVLYLEDVRSQPKPQYLKDCGYECYFDKFEEVMTPYVPFNYTEECKSNIFLD